MKVMRRVSLARASLLAWGAYAFYAVACAWPEVGGWPILSTWVFVAAYLVYGVVAVWRGWPVMAGCAAGCLAAPLLRAAVAEDGALAAGVGFGVAFVVVATGLLGSFESEVDDDGRVLARNVVTTLWLGGCLASGVGLVLADVVAWAVSHAA